MNIHIYMNVNMSPYTIYYHYSHRGFFLLGYPPLPIIIIHSEGFPYWVALYYFPHPSLHATTPQRTPSDLPFNGLHSTFTFPRSFPFSLFSLPY